MTAADNISPTTNPLGGCAKGEQASSLSEIDALTLVQDIVIVNAGSPPGLLSVRDPFTLGGGQRNVPARFANTDPIEVVVSQDGSIGGADPGSTVGAAILYLVTATPA